MYILTKDEYVPYDMDTTTVLLVSEDKQKLIDHLDKELSSDFGSWFHEADLSYREATINDVDISYNIEPVRVI